MDGIKTLVGGSAGGLSGSGTLDYIPIFTGASAIGNSLIAKTAVDTYRMTGIFNATTSFQRNGTVIADATGIISELEYYIGATKTFSIAGTNLVRSGKVTSGAAYTNSLLHGASLLPSIGTADKTLAIGYNILPLKTSGTMSRQVLIGTNILSACNNSSNFSGAVAIGADILTAATTSSTFRSVIIGTNIMVNNTIPNDESVIIGRDIGASITAAYGRSVIIGLGAAGNCSYPDESVYIGWQAGNAGGGTPTGQYCVVIGHACKYSTATPIVDRSLHIDTRTGFNNTLIHGYFGTTQALSWFRINGATEFGDQPGGNYTKYSATGFRQAFGTATWFQDLKLSSVNVVVVGTGVSINNTECTIDFTTTANLSDYVWGNNQLDHGWKAGSNLPFHIHFRQTQNAIPNLLMRYRWQRMGQSETTAWTDYPLTTNVFTYVSGNLNQIIKGAATITVPANYGLADILEVRVFRDNANTSGAFAGADAYTGDVQIRSMDFHEENDRDGTDTEYA